MLAIVAAASPPEAANPTSGTTGDPINTFTGELFDTMPADLVLTGPMPLVFRRYYASGLKKTGPTGRLGDNWLHNYEWNLATTASNTVRIVNHQGRLIEFTYNGSALVLLGRQDIPFQLSSNATTHTLGDPRTQMRYTFDSGGKLTQLSDGHGNTHTLTYTGNQLATVSDGLSRTLTFTYSVGGALTNVSDGLRNVGFVQTGNNLTRVRDPLGNFWGYAYDLGNLNPGLMTAWTNPVGNIPFAQQYDAQGRVTNQLDSGQFATTLIYSNLTTFFTDPRGFTRTHIHDSAGNLLTSRDEASLALGLGYNASSQRSSVTDRLGDTFVSATTRPAASPPPSRMRTAPSHSLPTRAG